ncbi:MAG: hypothetical protein HPY83_08300 [Anaerolineae bacterium]|nr:hypothetical protein [Anaerolineae bacterium]
MEVYRVETGMLSLYGIPFSAGERAEVILLSRQCAREGTERYPLRGMSIRHTDPYGSVDEGDRDALR